MRPEDLLKRLSDRPFKAFRIHLSDRTAIDVPEPGMVIVGRTTAVLPTRFTRRGNSYRIAEDWRTIALIHIVQFSDLDEKTDGRRKRRKPS
jgi:hypothetical protein